MAEDIGVLDIFVARQHQDFGQHLSGSRVVISERQEEPAPIIVLGPRIIVSSN
jgi:hypothetical protein